MNDSSYYVGSGFRNTQLKLSMIDIFKSIIDSHFSKKNTVWAFLKKLSFDFSVFSLFLALKHFDLFDVFNENISNQSVQKEFKL